MYDNGFRNGRFIFATMVGLIFVMSIVLAVLKKKRDSEDAAQPVMVKRAKLADMQQIPAGQIVLGEIWTMFELENGERIRLNAKVQNSLVIGDRGTLTWQGRRILKFERDISQ